jgi:O-antigen biosynthesis protein WbqP
MIDRFISAFLIILLLPFFAFIALLIVLEDGFPFYFVHIRVSGEHEFKFVKFRSMYKNAPNLSTNDFTDSHKYITRVGKIIRKTSIDETLNLINILKGEMHFIGPRPIIPEEKELQDLRKSLRVIAKPGITGLAQINGRDNISIREKVLYDKYFQIHKSAKLRTYIILKTLYIVSFGKDVVH